MDPFLPPLPPGTFPPPDQQLSRLPPLPPAPPSLQYVPPHQREHPQLQRLQHQQQHQQQQQQQHQQHQQHHQQLLNVPTSLTLPHQEQQYNSPPSPPVPHMPGPALPFSRLAAVPAPAPPPSRPLPAPAPAPLPPPPVQVPRLEPYLVLWKLAEDYFAGSRKLAAPALRTNDSTLLRRYHTLLLAGLKALLAILSQQKDAHTAVPLKVEMQTRLRIAEILVHETDNLEWAEDLLGKGILRIPKIPEFTTLKFAMQHLQAEILTKTSGKAARTHLKNCADEARDRGAADWEYAFSLLRCEGLSSLNPDGHEISQHTGLIHTLRTMAQRDAEWELYEFSFLLEIPHALLFSPLNVNIDVLLVETERLAQRPERRDIGHLTLMRLVFHVLHLIRLGDGAAAITKLREYHQFMDTRDQLDWKDDGKFELKISGGTETLQFQWFSKSESFLFGYLLSGIVYSPDYSSGKAWSFYMEGIRVADSLLTEAQYDTEGWLSEIIAKKTRLLRLKRYILLYASFTGLLRSNFQQVFTTIEALHAFNHEYFPPPPSPDDTTFQHLYTLLIAMQNHLTGFLAVASSYYESIPVEAGETYLLACLNRAVILRGGTVRDQALAGKILDEVENRMEMVSPAPQIRTAWNLIKGINSTEVLGSKYVLPPGVSKVADAGREFLTRVLDTAQEHLNRQLTVIALSAINTRYFINTSIEQAEKMALMAYINAGKGNDQLWQLINGKLLAGTSPHPPFLLFFVSFLSSVSDVVTNETEVYGKQDKLVKQAKQMALNEESRQLVREKLKLSESSRE